MGEWGTADDVWQAVEELGLDEVQHGIAAAESTGVMHFLADHQIRLNICPTSNVMLGRVDSIAGHPIRTLYDAGVIVTVNTDDVLMFGSSVSEEYIRLYEAGVFSTAELNQIREWLDRSSRRAMSALCLISVALPTVMQPVKLAMRSGGFAGLARGRGRAARGSVPD